LRPSIATSSSGHRRKPAIKFDPRAYCIWVEPAASEPKQSRDDGLYRAPLDRRVAALLAMTIPSERRAL
jgi:hypothetical protein